MAAPSEIGRVVYLVALQRHWPEVAELLRREVFPSYEPPPASIVSPNALPGVPDPGTWEQLKGDGSRVGFLNRLQFWAERFSIIEPWILDSALQTLHHAYMVKSMGIQSAAFGWHINPDLSGKYNFVPKLTDTAWIPMGGFGGGKEPWEEFKNRMLLQFYAELARFRNESNVRYGTNKKHLDRDARWTVLYKKGTRALKIAEIEADSLLELEDPEQFVYRTINRFAASIGLNLPTKPRRNRTVQPRSWR